MSSNNKIRKLEASSVVDAASTKPLRLLGGEVELPQDAIVCILEFLPRCQMVHSLSLVNKAWLSATRMPQLWRKLSPSTVAGLSKSLFKTPLHGNKDFLKIMLKIIKWPQFAILKSLVLPRNITISYRQLTEISKTCPLLEELHLGYEDISLYYGGDDGDEELFAIPDLFPNLSKVGLNMFHMTNKLVRRFLAPMGERLKEIHINTSDRGFYLGNKTLQSVGNICPNLVKFEYRVSAGPLDNDWLTDVGIQALLSGCHKLESLVLVGTGEHVTLEAFRCILDDGIGANLSSLVFHRRYRYSTSVLGGDVEPWLRKALEDKIGHCQWRNVEE